MSVFKDDADGRISMFLGNTLYAVALIYYSYITFLGYNCMSLLKYLIDFVVLQFLSILLVYLGFMYRRLSWRCIFEND
jgi:hypothetical protein